jgi:quercetin dioxygenase-like cupin family protein
VFRATVSETAGQLLSFDYFLRPGGSVPLAHVHPKQEERFEIISGTARVRVGWRKQSAGPGQTVVVPAGMIHRLWNAGAEELHAVVEFHPALRTEQAFEQLFGLARDGKLGKRGIPNPLRLAVMAREYSDEVALAFIPRRIQRAFFAVLAPAGRALGYAAFDPRYGPRLTA